MRVASLDTLLCYDDEVHIKKSLRTCDGDLVNWVYELLYVTSCHMMYYSLAFPQLGFF